MTTWVAAEGIRRWEAPTNTDQPSRNRDFFGGERRSGGARQPGTPLWVEDTPVGFLTQRPRGDIIPPHFHEVDQFQVVVDGRGTIGKHALEPVTVHYTDAYTPYGPITTVGDGMLFYTLRAQESNG